MGFLTSKDHQTSVRGAGARAEMKAFVLWYSLSSVGPSLQRCSVAMLSAEGSPTTACIQSSIKYVHYTAECIRFSVDSGIFLASSNDRGWLY